MKIKYCPITVLCILVLGVIFRVGQYACNRSLTEGEAPLAMNILERSYAQLAQPLSYVQAAPVGFLFMQKFMASTFGNTEYTLRFIPLIAGILALVLFYYAARVFLEGTGLLTALVLFAVNDQLIYFASEIKQYSTDVMFATALLLLGLWVIKKSYRIIPLILFGLFSGIAIWFSHPSLFVSAALFCVILVALRRDHKTRNIPWLVIAAVIAISSWLANYIVILAAASRQGELLNFWQRSFMPLPPLSFADIGWIVFAAMRIFKNPGGFSVYDALIAACACLTGLAVYWKTKKIYALILILPILLTLFASGFHIYPFEGRLLLFLVPFIAVMIAAGAEKVREVFSRTSKTAGALALALIMAYPVGSACYHLAKPRAPEELRLVLVELQCRRAPDQTIYVYYGAVNAFKYYARTFGFETDGYIQGVEARDNWQKYYDDLKKLASGGHKRAWVIMSHISTWNGVDEEKLFISYLDLLGKKVDAIRAPGAAAYLYDLFKENNEAHSDH
ncbi:MAG TPA: glycosyltransferase family 39 protein [bacterium]